MIRSMTGYGAGSCRTEDLSVNVEIRTVNHRFLDLHIRLAREYTALEADVQQVVRKQVTRGRVDVTINIESTRPVGFLVDANTVRNYLEATKRLRDEFNLEGSLDLKTLLSLPGVLLNRETLADQAGSVSPMLREALQKSLRDALEAAVHMRSQEGELLRADLRRRLRDIEECTKVVRNLAPNVTNEHRRRLEGRLAQILPKNGVDPQRLAQEVALLAERCDISEELTRLESHVEQFAGWMESAESEIGKKMDFLLQEMQRETNTILAKAGNVEITNSGIAIKSEIEKIREQVQNIE